MVQRDSSQTVTALRSVDINAGATQAKAVEAVTKALTGQVQVQVAPFTRHTDALLVDMKAEENRLHEALAKCDAELAKAEAAFDDQVKALAEGLERRRTELNAERDDCMFAFSGIRAMRDHLAKRHEADDSAGNES
jgi:predicted phage gp36 major capsid-like protein